ncbi:MAG: response regulator [Pseudomonadota bacterium]|nr:response regulator [Pseudomonadota bacterium]
MLIRKVLLVDDDTDIRTIGQICLSGVGGWETVLAANGEEALRLAASERPDVVLLDVMMPGMDGPSVLARLRADPLTAAIPVVFLTANMHRADLGHYLALGARGAIPKPFDPMRLPNEVRRILEREP